MFPTHSIAMKLSQRVLKLQMNGLSDRGIICLAAALSVNKCVEYLDLRDNNIGIAGAVALFRVLAESNNTIKTLDLSENRELGDPKCVEELVNVIRSNDSIQDLRLRSCKIGDRVADDLFQALSDAVNLLSLDLSQNDFTEKSASVVQKFLGQNIYLKRLNLGWNRFRDSGCRLICDGLKSNGVLEEFSICWNGLSDESCAVLSEVLASSDSLHALDIHNSRIGPSAAIALSKGLSENSSLTLLNLAENAMGDVGCSAILQAVRRHPRLSELDLRHCGGGVGAEEALRQTQLENQSLTKLHYSVDRVWIVPAASSSNATVAATQ
jgi:Ran GTPase-activating protein (RanGAP) involved in mRNA processing and transport